LSTPEIARAFVVPEATMAQRLVRAKRKLRGAGIPFAVPRPDLLPERLDEVLAVVYLVFNEGYGATGGDRFVRADLCEEAIRLARLLHRLLPDEHEVHGLLALLLLTDARRPARLDGAGHLVLLEDQDRSQWDRAAIAEGAALLAEAWQQGPPGRYSIQAAIALQHDQAPVAAATDWARIAELYLLLAAITGSVIVELNRAVAVSMADGPGAGLHLVDALGDELDGYLPYHATRGDLLRRLDRPDEAHASYARALAMAATEPERAFFAQRLAETAPIVDVPGSGGDARSG
jgi:RNA polymerase sigma-70 factor (ECF subfamily)